MGKLYLYLYATPPVQHQAQFGFNPALVVPAIKHGYFVSSTSGRDCPVFNPRPQNITTLWPGTVFHIRPFPLMCTLQRMQSILHSLLILGSVFSDCVVSYGDVIKPAYLDDVKDYND